MGRVTYSRYKTKGKGTEAETAAARWLTDVLGMKVTRTPQYGSKDRGDLQGVPNLCVELKNTKRPLFVKWAAELECECLNAACGYGVVLWSPPGLGPKRIERWAAIEYPESCLGRFAVARGDNVSYTGPISKFAAVFASYGHMPMFLNVTRPDGVTVQARVRRAADWLTHLQDHLAGELPYEKLNRKPL